MTDQRPFSCILEQFQTLPKFHNSHPYYKEKVQFCLLKKMKKYFEQVLFMQNFTYFLYMNENVWNFRVVCHKFLDESCRSGWIPCLIAHLKKICLRFPISLWRWNLLCGRWLKTFLVWGGVHPAGHSERSKYQYFLKNAGDVPLWTIISWDLVDRSGRE
jgi:hypothetical protein